MWLTVGSHRKQHDELTTRNVGVMWCALSETAGQTHTHTVSREACDENENHFNCFTSSRTISERKQVTDVAWWEGRDHTSREWVRLKHKPTLPLTHRKPLCVCVCVCVCEAGRTIATVLSLPVGLASLFIYSIISELRRNKTGQNGGRALTRVTFFCCCCCCFFGNIIGLLV